MIAMIEGLGGAAMFALGFNLSVYQGLKRTSIPKVALAGTLSCVGLTIFLQAVINYFPTSVNASLIARPLDNGDYLVTVTRTQLRSCDPVQLRFSWEGMGWYSAMNPDEFKVVPPNVTPLTRSSYSFLVQEPPGIPRTGHLTEVYDCGARKLLETSYDLDIRNPSVRAY